MHGIFKISTVSVCKDSTNTTRKVVEANAWGATFMKESSESWIFSD